MPFHIRRISAADHADWLNLWQMYCAFYEVSLNERVTERTWERLCDPASAIHGLIARGRNEALGICHYIRHPNTWSDKTVCCLEDLFVAPSSRRLGVATAFIEKLKDVGQANDWARIYWITNSDNLAAQAAYDRVAQRSGHVRYEISLK